MCVHFILFLSKRDYMETITATRNYSVVSPFIESCSILHRTVRRGRKWKHLFICSFSFQAAIRPHQRHRGADWHRTTFLLVCKKQDPTQAAWPALYSSPPSTIEKQVQLSESGGYLRACCKTNLFVIGRKKKKEAWRNNKKTKKKL